MTTSPQPRDNPLTRPDWQLPPGVPRSLWEYVHDDGIATDDERFLAGEHLLDIDRTLTLKIADRIQSGGASRCLDMGCGTGRLASALLDRGWQVIGVDLSQPSLKLARAAGSTAKSGHLALLRANLCELHSLAGPPFDLALLMFGTLGMVSGPDHRAAVLTAAARLLSEGGTLLLHVHNWWRHIDHPTGRRWLLADLWRIARRLPEAGDTRHDYRGIPDVYHHVFRRSEVRQLLKNAGFTVEQEWPLALPGQGEAGLLTGSPWTTSRRCTGWIIAARKDG